MEKQRADFLKQLLQHHSSVMSVYEEIDYLNEENRIKTRKDLVPMVKYILDSEVKRLPSKDSFRRQVVHELDLKDQPDPRTGVLKQAQASSPKIKLLEQIPIEK